MTSAKFGKDLFNISKVIGRKTKWPRFFAYPVHVLTDVVNAYSTGSVLQITRGRVLLQSDPIPRLLQSDT